jgi:3-hydroxyisobutyrate dehydrogenase-like beta-hydroxyacid dehydrogenase
MPGGGADPGGPAADAPPLRVAVAGLGSMGEGAALSLARQGFAVTGAEPRETAWVGLVAAGGRAVPGADALPGDLDALVLFVVNASQADVVLGQALERVAPGGVVINCVTVAPEAARRIAAGVEAAGRLYLDAPVSGGRAGAMAGTMTVMASGSPAAFERAAPVLDAMAGKVWRLGDAPGAGSTVKMVNQLLAGVHIAAAAEAMALGIRAGADPQAVFDVITSSAGNSWMFQNRVPHILAGDDTPLSAVSIFVKDLGIVLDQARALTFPLPMASSAHQLFLAAAAAGQAGRDDAFVIRVWERLAGIALPEKEDG